MRDEKVPKGIGFEVDLYALPEGVIANGLTLNQIERALGRSVDERIGPMAAEVETISGRIADEELAKRVVWLAQTFLARSPDMVRQMESAGAEVIRTSSGMIHAMLVRAVHPSSRDELRSMLDPRRPRGTALTAVAAVIESPFDLPWLRGDVHVVRREDVQGVLNDLGTDSFITFEDPVMHWGDDANWGLQASFTLSPRAMVLVFAAGSSPSRDAIVDITSKHALRPLPSRSHLLTRTPITGRLLCEAAAKLKPDARSPSKRREG